MLCAVLVEVSRVDVGDDDAAVDGSESDSHVNNPLPILSMIDGVVWLKRNEQKKMGFILSPVLFALCSVGTIRAVFLFCSGRIS